MTSLNTGENNQMRVMSTPTWPVPYYQRAFRDPKNIDKAEGDLEHIAVPVSDSDVIIAKELLLL